MNSQAFQLNCDSNAMQRFMLANILNYFMTNHHSKWNCTPLWSPQSKIQLPTCITFEPWEWITRRLYFERTSPFLFFFVGVRQLWADIHSFGFWCKWVCFQTQSGRGKEYSITNGLIKCPLQSGVSGLVLIQILKLHLSLPPPPILWMLPKTFVSTLIFWGEMSSFSHSLCPLFVSRAVK